ncbi:hypothetical protein H8K32_07035 [Undibacterium jejuense]|uniref:Uncharacterized protein n=1 Tax=Undibacterium jejuense TaxID=1344949 RepID=A0A923HNG1_9BURK|nr:hypothetical protein [Undibacterium jejuense]MBC3861848.1 hypothetical protein [Undibacterium jejuense]
MASLILPLYVLEYTPKTIDSVLSPAALEGKEVEVDVYDRRDVTKKHIGIGRRIKGESDVFRVRVAIEAGQHEDEWSYTILRESAGRSRKARK